MKKKMVVFVVALMGMFMVFGTASASLIGSTLGNPKIFSGDTSYSYTAQDNLFSMTATPLEITFDGLNFCPISGQRVSYSADFYVDNNGDFMYGAGEVGKYDLEIWGEFKYEDVDYTGLLLGGNINNFGWFDLAGSGAVFDFTFDVLDGKLSEFYPDGVGGDYFVSLTSDFHGWGFDHGNSCSDEHTTGPIVPVPEPASMMLLGAGLLGLVGLRKKGKK